MGQIRQLASSSSSNAGGRKPLPPTPRVFPKTTNASSNSSSSSSGPPIELSGPAASKTHGIGTGKAAPGVFIKDRGPVSWPSLFLVGIAAASCVAYYNIERERRLESAMGRVVSSESDGWTPNPNVMAPRKFKLTPWGWFPEDDGFGPCKSASFNSLYLLFFSFYFVHLYYLKYILQTNRKRTKKTTIAEKALSFPVVINFFFFPRPVVFFGWFGCLLV